jgi:hypothetical protein
MADYSELLSAPTEVSVETAHLVTNTGRIFDITNIMVDLTLYEDIFSNTMSGYIIIQDANDMIENLPLVGEEQFKIRLSTPTLKDVIEKTFYIYKLEARVLGKRTQTYQLDFCSRELIYSMNSKVSKAFEGKISDTVVDIFSDTRYLASESDIYVEDTLNEYQFVAPFWSPLATINWLAMRSINENEVSNYVFFESNQSFEFVSIDTLIGCDPVFEYFNSDVDQNTVYGAESVKEGKYAIVESVQNDITFDYLRNISSGMYASKLYTYDMTSKAISANVFDYIDNYEDSTHTGDIPLSTENLSRKKLASLYFVEKNDYLNAVFAPQGHKDFFIQRNALMEQMSNRRITIKVPGRTDIKVGNVINYTTLQIRKLNKEDIEEEGISKYFTGKYLITAIRHQIMSGVHYMFMEIVSDSFIEKVGV